MRRWMLIAAGLVFLLFAWAFAADPPVANAPAAPAKADKITKMRAPGTILEISDTLVKIERKITHKVETMEFILEKPVKFKAGDRVRVSYVEKDGKMIATRIVKAAGIHVKKSAAVNSAPATGSPPAK
jgi:predicted phage tail protein